MVVVQLNEASEVCHLHFIRLIVSLVWNKFDPFYRMFSESIINNLIYK